jgi:hypothetical protein
MSSSNMVYQAMCSNSMGVGWGSGYVAGLFGHLIGYEYVAM